MIHAESTEHDGRVIAITIPSDGSACEDAIAPIERCLNDHMFGKEEIGCIMMALMEAITNAIKHGNQKDQSKKVGIHYVINGERFDCRISDEGDGFDRDEVPDPTDPENLERTSGRGLLLIERYMTRVEYKPGIVMLTRLRGEAHKKHKDAGAGNQIESVFQAVREDIGAGLRIE